MLHADVLAQTICDLLEAEAATRKPRDVLPLERRLTRALRATWRAQSRAVLAALDRHRSQFDEAVEADVLDQAVHHDPRLEATLAEVLAQAVARGGRSAVVDLGTLAAFDLDFPDAVAWLEGRAAARVAAIDDTTRDYLRTILRQAGEEGWSYQRTARRITDRFAEFARGVPQQHIRSRAELIAVTELGEAYETGHRIGAARLEAQGLAIEKQWLSAGDERVCPQCAPAAAEGWIANRDQFANGLDGPPGHPGCRCATQRRVKETP